MIDKMDRLFQLLLLLLLILSMTGCGSVSYLKDRGHDAADIVTLAAGAGLGAKARIGIFQVVLPYYCGLDLIGLRGGELFFWATKRGKHWEPLSADLWFISIPLKLEYWDYPIAGLEIWIPGKTGEIRGKKYYAESTIPFVVNRMGVEEDQEDYPNVWSHYSAYQTEVAAGCIPSARVGFNTAELLDFLLGWATIDILNDDIGQREIEIVEEIEIEETKVISR